MPDNIIITERSGNYKSVALWALLVTLTLGLGYQYSVLTQVRAELGELSRDVVANAIQSPSTDSRQIGDVVANTEYNEVYRDELPVPQAVLEMERSTESLSTTDETIVSYLENPPAVTEVETSLIPEETIFVPPSE